MYNQNEYIKQYNKNSYKNIALRVKPDIYAMIEKYCNDMKISKNAFLINAAAYIIDNDIPISEIMKWCDIVPGFLEHTPGDPTPGANLLERVNCICQ